MSGCLNSGADGSWHVRQTTNPVITPYTQIAKANSAMANHGVSRIRGEYRQPGCRDARQFPAATARSRSPIQRWRHSSRTVGIARPSHANAAAIPRDARVTGADGSRVPTTAHAATNVNSCSGTSRSSKSGRNLMIAETTKAANKTAATQARTSLMM